MIGSPRKRLLIALLFLAPNLLGFLLFTAGPILFSLVISLTDWALTKHNALGGTPVRFIGLDNYARLLWGDESHLFWDYFGNTLFLMIGIPVGIAGSLGLALLLNTDFTPTSRRSRVSSGAIAGALTIIAAFGTWLLTTPGPRPADALMSTQTGLTDLSVWQVDLLHSNGAILAIVAVGLLTTLGLAIGGVFFRTIFYLPNLLAGVALFLLWKTLYKPRGGLINAGLEPILASVHAAVTSTPPVLWYAAGIAMWTATGLWSIWLVRVGIGRLAHGETSRAAFGGRLALVATLVMTGLGGGYVLVQLPPRALLVTGRSALTSEQLSGAADEFTAQVTAHDPSLDAADIRLATRLLGETASARATIDLLAEAAGNTRLARRAARRAVLARSAKLHDGFTAGPALNPPQWLIDSAWAKTALVIMGIWFSLGGSTMLLYLAGLANIPQELYEAAAIDGATGFKRFANITWPQLAPTTFFIVIMATIGGLQGGFEQAMVMTDGKADTIVLAYYIYNLAFSDQFQLGLASAVAWVMFIFIFAITALNFRLGSQLTNE